MLCLCGHPAAAHTVECDEPGCPCLGFAPVLNERMRIVYVNAAGEEVPYSPGPDDICDAIEGHAAQAEHNRSGEPTVPWADAEAELNLAPVAEGPYVGIDVSESPDVSAVVLFNRETGEFAATGGAYGFLDFPAYAVQGGGLIGDPLKDITARQTNTIADHPKWPYVFRPAPKDHLPPIGLDNEPLPPKKVLTIADLSKKEWKP